MRQAYQRQSLQRYAERLAHGQTSRIHRRWRRFARKQFEAITEALLPFAEQRLTEEIFDAVARAVAAANADVARRHGRLHI